MTDKPTHDSAAQPPRSRESQRNDPMLPPASPKPEADEQPQRREGNDGGMTRKRTKHVGDSPPTNNQ
jgi:hypothetical protein